MLRYLWIEGNINCVLSPILGGEKGSASFKGTHPEVEISFSSSKVLKVSSIRVKEEEGQNPLTKITERSRQGEIRLRFFSPETPERGYPGGTTFFLDPTKMEQDVDLGNISVGDVYKGGIGTIAIKLSLKLSG